MKSEAECIDMLHKKCDECEEAFCIDCFALPAIDALVRRIPMKPTEHRIYRCPICNEPLQITAKQGQKLTRKVIYCCACGQAIDCKSYIIMSADRRLIGKKRSNKVEN